MEFMCVWTRTLGMLVPMSLFAAGAVSAADGHTNVILVLVDDLGWRDLSCQGSPYYRTPHVDELAKGGVRFTNGYAACAVCSPTRAAVMTGCYPARLGVTDWIRARFQRRGVGTPDRNPTAYVDNPAKRLLCPPNPYWMEHAELTIAEVLAPLGYATCHIGKWHLGDAAWYPQHQGFAENFGGCDFGQPPSYFDPFTNKRLPEGIPHLAPRSPGEYLTDREADEAVKFIRRNQDRPFFLYLAHYAVHTPIQAKPTVAEQYAPDRDRGLKSAAYAAMVESVDDAMGRVLETLETCGLTDRTLVIFTSDNGGLDRDGNPTENAPLRSGKGYPYEGGIRVPLIFRWPAKIAAGSVSYAPACSIDLFPTIVDAIGARVPEERTIDGLSLVDHLTSGGSVPLGRTCLFWHFPHYRHNPGPYSIVRNGAMKMIKYYEGPVFELYDLEHDPGESVDLEAVRPQQVAALNVELETHLQSVGAKLPRERPGTGGAGD